MATSFGQHSGHKDWLQLRHGNTSKLAKTNLGGYVEEVKFYRKQKNRLVKMLRFVYSTTPPDLLVSHKDIYKDVLVHIEGMPIETLHSTWRRWLRYGDKNFMNYLRKDLWIKD